MLHRHSERNSLNISFVSNKWSSRWRRSLTIIVIAVPGDVTGDGIVDYRDLVAVIEHWGEPDTTYDADGNGEVGYSDLTFIVANWTG